MPLQPETVAIPVTSGLDLTTEARLVEAPGLLEASNVRFPRHGGAAKRRGNTQINVLGSTAEPAGNPPVASNWVYGFGYTEAAYPFNVHLDTTHLGSTAITPDYPNNLFLYGAASRDAETLVWNGHLMYSYSPAEAAGTGFSPKVAQIASNAVMPSLNATPIAKVQTAQLTPDFADNGVIKVVTWMDASATVYCAVYDSVTGAPIVTPRTLVSMGATIVTAYQVRVFSLGTWVHIVIADTGAARAQVVSISQDNPTGTVVQRSYGACGQSIDIWKIDETLAVLAKSNGTSVDISWITTSGAASATRATMSIPVGGTVGLVSVCTDAGPINLNVLYSIGSTITIKTMDAGTYVVSRTQVVSTVTTPLRLTMAPRYVYGFGVLVDIYYDANSGGNLQLNRRKYDSGTGLVGPVFTKYHQGIASRAFTVGDRTFVWTGHNSTLQSTWFLLDDGLDPVGHMDFGVANPPSVSSNSFTASVNFVGTGELTTTCHTALGFRVRVPATAATTGVFSEPSIKAAYLNFLPKLRSAQAGRCTYFAGAQVWQYDGQELVEAGFHIGPELATPSVSAGGVLSNPGSYSYRVDLCYRNAQNEEVRSLSILTTSVSTTNVNKTITLTIPTCITRRPNAYFLIYRNAVSAGVPLTNWWLLNSRDPSAANFYPNTQSVASFTVVDDGTVGDAAIQNFELHPATGDNYLQPVAPPACEVIAAGHDRLWVAGGELAPGLIAPSRLFDPGQAPAFNPYLNIQVDRGYEPITAIGMVGNLRVFFRKNNTYVLDSDGPDNSSNGLWEAPRLALADIGAVSQTSLALISQGLLFQSGAGARLISPSGNLAPVGAPMDFAFKTADIQAAVVVNSDQEVRWYCTDRVLVYNYLYDAWSTWSFGAVGAVRMSSGLVATARSDGKLWIETNGVWADGPGAYTMRVRFPWLHAGNLGDFQRVRRIQGIGRYSDLTSPTHNVHVDIYYDERDFAEESFDWVMPDATSSNVDTWGAATWGAGVWGDTTSVAGELHDNTWEWVRRPARQKCSVFSVAVDDNNTVGPGFVLTALGLELAKKMGLNRTPERGGSENSR